MYEKDFKNYRVVRVLLGAMRGGGDRTGTGAPRTYYRGVRAADGATI